MSLMGESNNPEVGKQDAEALETNKTKITETIASLAIRAFHIETSAAFVRLSRESMAATSERKVNSFHPIQWMA